MTLLEWSPALALGLEPIDEQHRGLVDTLNNLNTQILIGKNSEGCSFALHSMQEYTIVHFTAEEGLMKNSSYSGLAHHHELHQKFIEQTQLLSASDCDKSPEKALKILDYLQEWLVDHILGPDLIFARYYQKWHEEQ